MAGSSPSEIIFISINQSITLIGKVWLVVMIFLRVFILLLAGYPLYQDEQERFVCNTIQPGCANVCYDIFSPISLFRFWLVQLVTLSLPYIIFTIYVIHKVSNGLTITVSSFTPGKTVQPYKIQQGLSVKTSGGKKSPGLERGLIRCFTSAYIFQLLFRTSLEAGFGAAHYYMFGFYIPRRFLCQHPPCTTQVDCYVSRPTEKTVMLNFMFGVSALSLFLNALDFICAIKRSVRQKSPKKLMGCVYEDKFPRDPDANSSLGFQALEMDVGPRGSFRKRQGSRTSLGIIQDAAPSEPLGCDANGNNGYSPSQEALEKEVDQLALCPLEPTGTPKAICDSKHSRLKPPPPPRRDLHPAMSPRPKRDEPIATGACMKRIGQYTLMELGSGTELSNDEGQEKRSEWV